MDFLTELFDYQQRAVDKMIKVKVGALYMEQGIGKTRTALEIIKIRLEKEKIDNVLWFCPCSVKSNLKKDIIKHTGSDQANIIRIAGIESMSSSERLFDELKQYVTERTFIIVDESILVKNFFSIRTRRITELCSVAKYKILMNGTPISVNEGDLFAQWYMLDWRILGYKSYYSFAANHYEYDKNNGRITKCLNADNLVKKISPYTYEIKKKDCLTLPDKRYYFNYYTMPDFQLNEYYEAYVHFMGEIDEFESTTVYRFFTALQDVVAGLKVREEKKKIVTSKLFDNPNKNPRIAKLLEILDDEKTIIFAKYTHEIDDIVQVLEEKYGKGCAVKFCGDISLKQRQNSLQEFENNDKVKYFIANQRCGAYGLNLQFCNHMIFYSFDFNMAIRLQAEDRIHRIGQDKDVLIEMIVAEDTIDEFICNNLDKKENLISYLMQEIKKNNGMIKETLEQMISQKAHLE